MLPSARTLRAIQAAVLAAVLVLRVRPEIMPFGLIGG
jgi:hypothetical protein